MLCRKTSDSTESYQALHRAMLYSAYVFLFLSFSFPPPFTSVESHPRVKNRSLTCWETRLPRCVIPRGLTLRVFDGRGGLLCRILRKQWRRWEIRQGDCVTPDLCDLRTTSCAVDTVLTVSVLWLEKAAALVTATC